MFDVGFLEGVVICLVALLVLGPAKLVEIARVAGRWLGKMRRQYTDIKDELNRELELEEMRERLKAEERALREQMQGVSPNAVQQELRDEIRDEIRHTIQPPPPESTPDKKDGEPQ